MHCKPSTGWRPSDRGGMASQRPCEDWRQLRSQWWESMWIIWCHVITWTQRQLTAQWQRGRGTCQQPCEDDKRLGDLWRESSMMILSDATAQAQHQLTAQQWRRLSTSWQPSDGGDVEQPCDYENSWKICDESPCRWYNWPSGHSKLATLRWKRAQHLLAALSTWPECEVCDESSCDGRD